MFVPVGDPAVQARADRSVRVSNLADPAWGLHVEPGPEQQVAGHDGRQRFEQIVDRRLDGHHPVGGDGRVQDDLEVRGAQSYGRFHGNSLR